MICVKQKTLLIEQFENLFYYNVLINQRNNFKGKTMDDLYKPSNKIVENAHINKLKYEEMYKESISNPIKFWGEHGKRIDLKSM